MVKRLDDRGTSRALPSPVPRGARGRADRSPQRIGDDAETTAPSSMAAALEQLVEDDDADAIAAHSVPLPDEFSLKLALGPLDLPLADRSAAARRDEANAREAARARADDADEKETAEDVDVDGALRALDALEIDVGAVATRASEHASPTPNIRTTTAAAASPGTTVPPLPPGPLPRLPPPPPSRPPHQAADPLEEEPLPRFPLSEPPPRPASRETPRREARPATVMWLLLVGAGVAVGYAIGFHRASSASASASVAGRPSSAPASTPTGTTIARADPSQVPPREDVAHVALTPSALPSAAVASSAPTTVETSPARPPPRFDDDDAARDTEPPSRPAGPDTAAMTTALGAAASLASSCTSNDGSRDASVAITFLPSGEASVASVRAPADATACITQHFSGLRVPPFLGAAVTTYKSFELASR